MDTFLAAFPPFFIYLFVFFARVADMSLDVFRILMLTKGKKLEAALIGFIEVSIFITALGQVLVGGFDNPWMIVAYAGGFAVGNYIGSILEEKVAIGYLSLHIFPEAEHCSDFINVFREAGYGVTCIFGHGRSGERNIIYVFLKRKDLNHALKLIKEIQPDAFYDISDARQIHGGVFRKRL